jgi:hypothetical protein
VNSSPFGMGQIMPFYCNSGIYYSPAFVVLFMFLTFSDGFWGLQFPKNFPGGSAPLAPRQGLRPWTPLGAAPPDPCRSSLGGAPRHLTRAARYLLASLASSLPPMKNPAYGPDRATPTVGLSINQPLFVVFMA